MTFDFYRIQEKAKEEGGKAKGVTMNDERGMKNEINNYQYPQPLQSF
jgi:hypothetical protein